MNLTYEQAIKKLEDIVNKLKINTISCDFPIDLSQNVWYTYKATRKLGGEQSGKRKA